MYPSKGIQGYMRNLGSIRERGFLCKTKVKNNSGHWRNWQTRRIRGQTSHRSRLARADSDKRPGQAHRER